ncbi:ribonuclease Z, mitochondrial isoform X1 [Hydra vulgaris]|uniref:ribonuclease Z, mitochondrial isoform X1 n=1 Tax=Hydra vulgaris TaxID=6087 RepID=UPI001F5FF26B|nr:ribonuclease Z, mitochondrial [Hydra vulgaris]
MSPQLRPSKNVIMQVLWTGIDSSVPSLYIFTDSKKYLFNCGEGMQRIFTSNKMLRFGRLDTFFMTRHEWTHMGGLPGFGMTLRDMKRILSEQNQKHFINEAVKYDQKIKSTPEIMVHAPPSMIDVITGAQTFMRFDNSGVNFKVESSFNKCFTDGEMTVFPILIESEKEENKSLSQAMSYLCQLLPLPGKFLIKDALRLGVPKGPLFGALSRGESVTLPCGKVISPEQVMEPQVNGVTFFVLDCPTELHIKSLQEGIKQYMKLKSSPHLVIHAASKSVCNSDFYKLFLQCFPPSTQHLYLSECQQRLSSVFGPQHEMQMKLHQIHPIFFPLIELQVERSQVERNGLFNFSRIKLRDVMSSIEYDNSQTISEIEINTIPVANNFKTENDFFNSAQLNKSNNIFERVSNLFRKRKSSSSSSDEFLPPKKNDNQSFKEYPKVVFFGTGSSIPSKLRNVSSTLLFFSEDEAVLLDCGEECYGQLFRHYGNKITHILRCIKIILISHMHADHHLGLFTLLDKMKLIEKDSVILVAPEIMMNWLNCYKRIDLKSLNFISNEKLMRDGEVLFRNIHVQSVKVDHPGHAYGFVISKDRCKVTFSGDTLPSNELIKAGEDSTILIHEATMEDDKAEEAFLKKHSTIGQAFVVAQKMKAKNLLLTHFSQRYPKIPNLNDIKSSIPFVLAFDHMEVSMDMIDEFESILPQLNFLFSTDTQEIQEVHENAQVKTQINAQNNIHEDTIKAS